MTSRFDSVACVLGLSITLFHSVLILPARSDEPAAQVRRPELKYQRWSGPINVPDPVAISVADNGDVYVTQTQRRKIQDLDIRAHKQWIPDDVGLTSVEDKIAFYHRVLAIGGDQVTASKDVEDVNGDGTHDWRDLTVISEKIHRLVDSDGDSVATTNTAVTTTIPGPMKNCGKFLAKSTPPTSSRRSKTTRTVLPDSNSIPVPHYRRRTETSSS